MLLSSSASASSPFKQFGVDGRGWFVAGVGGGEGGCRSNRIIKNLLDTPAQDSNTLER